MFLVSSLVYASAMCSLPLYTIFSDSVISLWQRWIVASGPINWNKLAGITGIYPIPGGDMLKIDEQHQRLRKFWPYLDPNLPQSNNNMITPWDNSYVATTASVSRSSYILWTFCGLIEFQLVNYPKVETESLNYKAKKPWSQDGQYKLLSFYFVVINNVIKSLPCWAHVDTAELWL